MTLPLKLGTLLVASLFGSALLAFGALDAILPPATRDVALPAVSTLLAFCYLSLWAWMVVDHVTQGDGSHTVIVSLFLILGGGLAALVYFFTVFRPREVESGLGNPTREA